MGEGWLVFCKLRLHVALRKRHLMTELFRWKLRHINANTFNVHEDGIASLCQASLILPLEFCCFCRISINCDVWRGVRSIIYANLAQTIVRESMF